MIKLRLYHLFFLCGILGIIFLEQSCTHDPQFMMDTDPNPPDTMIVDTTKMDMPCDPNIIYFKKDILPILKGSCAFSGCHDAASARDGVILETYDQVIKTAKVVPFDLNKSELYEVITEDDPRKVMPPSMKLDNNSINIIAQWILQGAEDLTCEEACATDNVTYSGFVQGVIDVSCIGCHGNAAPQGGVVLEAYSDVQFYVNNGKLMGTINCEPGFLPMPFGQNKLDTCTILKIKSWINDGAPEN